MRRRDFIAGSAGWCGSCALAYAQAASGIKPLTGSGATSELRNRLPAGDLILTVPAGARCGVVDPVKSAGGLTPKAYGLKATTWGNKHSFAWAWSGDPPPGIALNDLLAVIQTGFNTWSGAAPLLRAYQDDTRFDIKLHLSTGPAGLGATTLGQTNAIGTDIQLNNIFKWSLSAAKGPLSAQAVLTHEIGHALGLLHANTSQSIMFPTNANLERLGRDDYDAIRALYGWPEQHRTTFGTEQSPALCACGDYLAMVWRGTGDDRNIWISVSTDGLHWTPQRNFSDVATIAGPALAWDGGRLWMVWRGTGDDQTLYFKTSTDFFVHDNPPQKPLSFAGSSHGPRIAIIQGIPTMVWKGINQDQRVFTSEYRSGQWQGQKIVNNIASAAAPAICEDIGGGARLVWRGLAGDQNLYTTFAPPNSDAWAPQRPVTWNILGNGSTTPIATGTAQSWGGPSITVEKTASNFTSRGDTILHAAWRGIDGDQGLYFTKLALDQLATGPTVEWSSVAKINGVGSSQPPSIVSFKGQLILAWKGVENDRAVYTVWA